MIFALPEIYSCKISSSIEFDCAQACLKYNEKTYLFNKHLYLINLCCVDFEQSKISEIYSSRQLNLNNIHQIMF